MATVSHTPPPTPAAPPGPLKLAVQFTLGVVLLLLVGLLAWTFFGAAAHNFLTADGKRVLERQKILADRQTKDHKYLTDRPSWFKKDAGLVRVPLDQAMKLALADLQKTQPHAAYPVAGTIMDSAAPQSPDKGAGSVPGVTANPGATNTTTGHPVPTPAPSATPALPPGTQSGAQSSPPPGGSPAPAAPTPSATNPAPTQPNPTATPVPSPAATPAGSTQPTGNNQANPGAGPVPGTRVQTLPTPLPEVTATPAAGAKPAPLATPVSQVTPTPGAATTPDPTGPGAQPGHTP